MKLNYSIYNTNIGNLLIASTTKGICFLGISDSQDILIESLKKKFPNLILQHHLDANNIFFESIDQLLKKKIPIPQIPLDLYGTDFQITVWRTLSSIPYGATLSYSAVAKKIGTPKIVRAVARAISKNPVAILVPCHRVIAKNGNLTGYRWGLDIKKILLNLETQK